MRVDLYLKRDPSESIADKLVKAGVVKSIREKIESLGKTQPGEKMIKTALQISTRTEHIF